METNAAPSIIKFDHETYYKNSTALLKKFLEEDLKVWNNWTKSNKRYMLICNLVITENDVNNNSLDKVSANLDCHISSNNLEDLKLFWKSKFIQQRYDNTMQHFIVDIKEKKVIQFVSVCI